MLRYNAILKLQHAGGQEGLNQWRVFDRFSESHVRRNKIDLWHYHGCPYTVPAVLPEYSAGLFILDVRGRFWDRRVEWPPGPTRSTVMAHGGWFNPMVPNLIDAGLKPIIFIHDLRKQMGTMACYELLGFKKEADMVAAEAILEGYWFETKHV